MRGKGCSPWLTLAPTLTALSFSSLLLASLILMGNMLCLEGLPKGMGVVRSVEHVTTTEEHASPSQDVVIHDCGEIPEGEDDGICNFFNDGDVYPDWPIDLNESHVELSWWMETVDSVKASGNEHFKKQDYKMALRKYRKALRYLDICWEKDGIDQETSTALRKTKSQIFTNSAACKLKFGDAKGALLDTEFAMREEDNNVKALFRQGQAYVALNNIDAAAESLEKALQFEPTDAGLKKEYAAVMKKIAIRDNEEKKQYPKMFG
ncbi:hypothetical protein Bca101_065747 [Brassica carinata]